VYICRFVDRVFGKRGAEKPPQKTRRGNAGQDGASPAGRGEEEGIMVVRIMPLGHRHFDEDILAPVPTPAPRRAAGLADVAAA